MTARSTRSHQLAAAWERTYAAGRETPPPPFEIDAQTTMARSTADALAAWRRWHTPLQRQRFSQGQRPWYDVLERARVETLAAAKLPGMASNLSTRASIDYPHAVIESLYYAARRVFAHQSPTAPVLVSPNSASQSIWPVRLVRSLAAGKRKRERLPAAQAITESQLLQALREAADHLNDGETFTNGLVDLIEQLARLYPLDAAADAEPDQEGQSDGSEQEDDQGEEVPIAALADELADRDDGRRGYAVFSRRRDEEHPASHWATPEDATALRQLNNLDRRRVRQLAHRLQRKLTAARQRYWQFDQEEGRLDSRRLAQLIGDTPTRRVFRHERVRPLPDACVTLLVDQSGSMSGRRRHMAALAIDLAVHTLETCQIRCEVLGFTTRYGSDNPLAADWSRNRQSDPPGRLNAIRHVIYKTAEQPWRRMRPQLGYLLRELPGHENIDGEALHWAATRLAKRPEPHKVLIVLSDGAPFDAATAQANGREFLERHLRHIIAEVESSPIHLAAIGTGQDVARFYRQVLTVRQPDEVADRLFEQLSDLLIPTHNPRELS